MAAAAPARILARGLATRACTPRGRGQQRRRALPNTTCLPFSHGVSAVVMKNCATPRRRVSGAGSRRRMVLTQSRAAAGTRSTAA